LTLVFLKKYDANEIGGVLTWKTVAEEIYHGCKPSIIRHQVEFEGSPGSLERILAYAIVPNNRLT